MYLPSTPACTLSLNYLSMAVPLFYFYPHHLLIFISSLSPSTPSSPLSLSTLTNSLSLSLKISSPFLYSICFFFSQISDEEADSPTLARGGLVALQPPPVGVDLVIASSPIGVFSYVQVSPIRRRTGRTPSGVRRRRDGAICCECGASKSSDLREAAQ